MSKNLQTRSALFLIAILVVPFTFYFAYPDFAIGFEGLNSLSSTLEYVSSDSITAYAAVAYLLAFFALIVKRNANLRVFLIYISALFEMSTILALSRSVLDQGILIPSALKVVFFSSPNLAPVQAFNSLALILWTVLIYQERGWLLTKTKNLFSAFKSNGEENSNRFVLFRNKFASLILFITIVGIVVSGIILFGSYKKSAKLFEIGFQLELLFIAISLLLTILVETLLIFIPMLFLFDTREIWFSELHLLTGSLVDFKLGSYITRVISGYLYWFYTICAVALLALTAPMLTVVTYLDTAARLDPGFKPQLALIIVGIPALTVVIGYIVVLLLRIIFEIAVALIHIAENSRIKG